jgi:hypothetical protein
VLESPDVATLPADDPALHVVARKLDDRRRRLGRVARSHALEGVGDEIAGPTPRVELSLLVELTDAPRELVANLPLCALEELGLRLVHGEAGDPLELADLLVLGLLELDLEVLDVRLAIGEPLLATEELGQLPLELVLFRDDPLLELGDLPAALLGVALCLRPDADGLFPRLDLRLPPKVRSLTLGAGDELVAPRGCLAEARAPKHLHDDEQQARSEDEADSDSGGDEHGRSLGSEYHPPSGLSKSALIRSRRRRLHRSVPLARSS